MLSQGKQRGMSESSIFRLIAAFRRRKCFDIQSGTAYWILTFACGIWFLISEANAGKFSAAIVGGLTFLFVWALFDQLMHLAWPEAALFTLLRFKVLQ